MKSCPCDLWRHKLMFGSVRMLEEWGCVSMCSTYQFSITSAFLPVLKIVYLNMLIIFMSTSSIQLQSKTAGTFLRRNLDTALP